MVIHSDDRTFDPSSEAIFNIVETHRIIQGEHRLTYREVRKDIILLWYVVSYSDRDKDQVTKGLCRLSIYMHVCRPRIINTCNLCVLYMIGSKMLKCRTNITGIQVTALNNEAINSRARYSATFVRLHHDNAGQNKTKNLNLFNFISP